MKMIKVYYDNSSGGGYKYLNILQIVSVENLKRGWKDCSLIIDILGNQYYTNESVEEVLKNIEGVEA